ncbi:MAG: PIG-L family deacetylase [Acidobacteria bacterium]|nr:PIG-L family deacetylase [Acidobacteriota bacterium]
MEASRPNGHAEAGHAITPHPTSGGALFLLAHHDDEFFISPRILHEKRSGARVSVVFLTHGSIYGAPSAKRSAESAKALASLGIGATDILALGEKESIFDMSLCDKMDAAARALESWFAGSPPGRIYTHAWEGGHPDHDAAHLLGAFLAKRFGLLDDLYEFPCYSGGFGSVARVMRLRPCAGEVMERRLTLREGLRALSLMRYFPSQWKSLIGLLPEASWRLLVLRRESLRKVPARDYHLRPHPGRLFYERRYGISFETFISRAAQRYLPDAEA